MSDPLISASTVAKELGDVSMITIWRWEKSGVLPPAVRLMNRKYWRKSVIEKIKQSEGV